MIANYLRVTDPDQAPDRRFARAAVTAEAALADLVARARRRRPVRGRLAGFLLRRARSLAGLRETGKFAGLYPLREMRRQLLLLGADLVEAGRLERPDDIMFVTLDEARAADADLPGGRRGPQAGAPARVAPPHGAGRPAVRRHRRRGGAARRRPWRRRAARRRARRPGRVTGPARVVLDPATAHIEPGDILVAATTDPGWTPLFLTAAALVTETGAIMAHGPTVAREYGIPAVISVPGATELITTGQLITVDGAAGTVTLEP